MSECMESAPYLAKFQWIDSHSILLKLCFAKKGILYVCYLTVHYVYQSIPEIFNNLGNQIYPDCKDQTKFSLKYSGELECGTIDNKSMTIHHYGFGSAMYAVNDSSCKAVVGEGHHHFVMFDVKSDPQCAPYVHVSTLLIP